MMQWRKRHITGMQFNGSGDKTGIPAEFSFIILLRWGSFLVVLNKLRPCEAHESKINDAFF